jgi:hypothetical protein
VGNRLGSGLAAVGLIPYVKLAIGGLRRVRGQWTRWTVWA